MVVRGVRKVVIGRCIVCKSEVELSTLNDITIATRVVVPILCSNCRSIDDDIIIPRRPNERGSRGRKHTEAATSTRDI